MPKVQMNVRIDDMLKARGDAVFASLGLTPTDAVRALWEYAAAHADAPAAVEHALRTPSQNAARLEAEHRAALAQEAHGIVARFREQVGASSPVQQESIDYRALREEGWSVRLKELGDD